MIIKRERDGCMNEREINENENERVKNNKDLKHGKKVRKNKINKY